VVALRDGDVELLKQIDQLEEASDMEKDFKLGWSWRHVKIWPATLNRLCLEGYLETLFRSNSYTGYRLTDQGKTLVRGETSEASAETPQDKKLELPPNIFEDIIGHDEVKELLRASLRAEKPVHVLLAGPPALAKTLFLWDIERTSGEKAIWLVGSATSKAGLWDLTAERQPQALLIDELDKMNAADTAALLSMMEGGRMVRAKKGRELDLSHPLRVIAATNRLDRLSPELRSRFAIRRLNAYGRSDFLTVVRGVLVKRENASPELAEEIARRLDGVTQDVRDAVRIARLAPQLGVEKAVKLLVGDGG
jgi:Holliday junction DNA helicase RuvB